MSITALTTMNGVRVYIDENGIAQLHIEDVARGLGLVERKADGSEYVRWARVKGYLQEFGFATSGEFIPESIFYRLAMKANNEAAVAFQELVANEILPTIRRTGSYHASIPKTYVAALRLLADTVEAKEALQAQNQRMRPKVQMYDTLLSAKNAQSVGDVAKCFGWGRNRMFAFLRDQKVLMRGNVPYQQYLEAGYFEVREVPIVRSAGEVNVTQTLVTAKGLDFIGRLLKQQTSA